MCFLSREFVIDLEGVSRFRLQFALILFSDGSSYKLLDMF